jgi:hypothetical protein
MLRKGEIALSLDKSLTTRDWVAPGDNEPRKMKRRKREAVGSKDKAGRNVKML